jgi:hypothetical protein
VTGRGALFVVWKPLQPRVDGWSIEPSLERAVASFRAHHPELPHHVAWLPPGSTLHDKAGMFHHTPFDSTVFLDADTVVLGRLEYGFEMAERFGLACCHCVNPWLRRYRGVADDAIEYNTGVLFFTAPARAIFDEWQRAVPLLDSSARFVRDGQVGVSPRDDQLAFSQVIRVQQWPPFILPHNWNFTPPYHREFFGPIKVWHNYAEVPEAIREINRYYEQRGAIIQHHELTGETPSWLPARG